MEKKKSEAIAKILTVSRSLDWEIEVYVIATPWWRWCDAQETVSALTIVIVSLVASLVLEKFVANHPSYLVP